MVKTPVLFLLLLLPQFMQSQEELCIGTQHSLYSELLHEQRTYWIHLPEGYSRDTTQTYPVVYLLDGDSFFHATVGINKALASGKGRFMPPSILVGVLNTDRTRDLTPTASAAGRDGQIPPGAIPQGGGGETFGRFLTGELRNVIDRTYRTNGQNMLIGHSYGGLFTLHTFLHHTEWFDTYLALDPSFWWDRGQLSKEAATLIAGNDFTGKRLYIGLATQKRTDRPDIHPNRADTLLTEVLPQARNLRFFTKSFPDENHGTIPIPGIYDGIKQLFGK